MATMQLKQSHAPQRAICAVELWQSPVTDTNFGIYSRTQKLNSGFAGGELGK